MTLSDLFKHTDASFDVWYLQIERVSIYNV